MLHRTSELDKILVGKPEGKGRKHMEDLVVGGWIMLEWIIGNREVWLDSSGSRLGPVVGCCEHGNEPSSGSVTGGVFS
jgi:hypothetical protein